MSNTITTTASLKQILEHPGDFSGWLCLPSMPWALDTEGAFIEDGHQAEVDTPPATAPHPGWRVTLNSATIEDIVINAHDQVDEPSVAQLFDAFVYYVDNDEFILL
ncbi:MULTISPECIES: DUF7716 domain-containing protein [Burkholderia]|uniref:DUF7716 domain-containing protein n=1 Tax=Burkholderia contaminans TaxID=488447 RepID=A0A2S5DXY5_9BURK|nr:MULTISPECIES: hypothetical protein [Burkholderia]EKS9799460.1 hypothetical protein [Burkholderia cepacia]EKS9806376.1 hypothetical protein [Burkholderia cepacia]EKS9813850.1 hypothetical protein [Burkholderia cepacia]EKS9823625.1 hypothetical protein [Burkholderia cepacia]EKS9831293.1 hypothetical protein [Burkholderia cepacia]